MLTVVISMSILVYVGMCVDRMINIVYCIVVYVLIIVVLLALINIVYYCYCVNHIVLHM